MVRRHVTATLSIVDRERLEHVLLIISGASENIIHYIYYILCVYIILIKFHNNIGNMYFLRVLVAKKHYEYELFFLPKHVNTT